MHKTVDINSDDDWPDQLQPNTTYRICGNFPNGIKLPTIEPWSIEKAKRTPLYNAIH